MPGFENTAGRSANGADRVTDSRSGASARTPGSDVTPGSSPQRSAPSISRSSGAAGAPVAQTIAQSRTNVSAVTGSPSVNVTSLRSRNVNVFRSSDAFHDAGQHGHHAGAGRVGVEQPGEHAALDRQLATGTTRPAG